MSKLLRTLSRFNPSTRYWAPVLPTTSQPNLLSTPSRLTLTSWNIDAFTPRAISRARHILDHILEHPTRAPSDIIFLQEVTLGVRSFLLNDARVRAAFLLTDSDAEDQTRFEDVPFASMTLLSRTRFIGGGEDSPKTKHGGVQERRGSLVHGGAFRIALPSKYGRDALCVEMQSPNGSNTVTVFRLINVHLDSLDTLHFRTQQVKILTDVLRERPGECSGGIIAGDFNAIRPEDSELTGKNGLVDAWVALHGKESVDGATWVSSVQRRDGRNGNRLDKVALLGAKPEDMEVLRPGLIEVPKPGGRSVEFPWSDHCSLRCTFTI